MAAAAAAAVDSLTTCWCSKSICSKRREEEASSTNSQRTNDTAQQQASFFVAAAAHNMERLSTMSMNRKECHSGERCCCCHRRHCFDRGGCWWWLPLSLCLVRWRRRGKKNTFVVLVVPRAFSASSTFRSDARTMARAKTLANRRRRSWNFSRITHRSEIVPKGLREARTV